MRSKKAFEVQFNWVFVLIVGAAILVFFTAIAIKQKNVSEASAGVTVLKSMQAIVSSASVSTGTTKAVNIPNSKIEIGCNKISVGSASKQYGSLVLFAPNLVKGDKLITKTLPFSMPYRVTNFLYMTSPNVRYILVGDSELAKQANKSLPQELNKELHIAVPVPEDKNDHKVRFVFFGGVDAGVLSEFENMPDGDVTALEVSKISNDYGRLNFYKKSSSSWEAHGSGSYYIGVNSLIGAIYSDELETYDCNMRNAFSRLKLVTDVYIKRASRLAEHYITNNSVCGEIYQNSGLAGALNTIKSLSSDFSESSVTNIMIAADQLKDRNENAQLSSCSLIY